MHVLNIELDKEKMRRGHHKVCVRDGLIVGWIDLTEYLLASTYDEFIDSGKPHFLQEKRETSDICDSSSFSNPAGYKGNRCGSPQRSLK
ncbi:hypothetical protein AVEN_183147-1 [Araneus ventricosus]|uniref:Uncharacterized protein n=1 Tax=Araneus ventricosus TaxID=182803 RepID=A0A4Y2JS64_ARAVE|nr:hypothetical protein AVEN_20981-1 [Araneus ventricosus]GBM92055.1 hypothetical protein AVEN_77171-1 [Araneus ventricosus]GBM92082.1 hypothetical protein AVEN_117038-1 [Araneus ventricosus]GBM92139.1 hypothetical protein AVEN_183147-1 [Araneus ventricosus]